MKCTNKKHIYVGEDIEVLCNGEMKEVGKITENLGKTIYFITLYQCESCKTIKLV